jgi:hypothetical protein
LIGEYRVELKDKRYREMEKKGREICICEKKIVPLQAIL